MKKRTGAFVAVLCSFAALLVGTASLRSWNKEARPLSVPHHAMRRATRPPRAPQPTPPTTVDHCDSGTLKTGGPNVDLEIVGHNCTVMGSATPYAFHNVNIYGTIDPRTNKVTNEGTLTFLDGKIDFYAESILIENGGALKAGVAPYQPIGTNGGLLTIHLYGAETDPGITCKSNATMCGVSSVIWNNRNTATACTPIVLPGNVTDCFYKYDVLDDGDVSGAYFGHKVLAVSYGGTLNLSGDKGVDRAADSNVANSGRSWARLEGSLSKGAEVLHVDRFVDWKKGDHIVVTTTDYLPGHSEELIITAEPIFNFVHRRTTIHFTTNTNGVTPQGVKWAHYGKMFPIPQADVSKLGLGFTHVDTRAAVALLSRSIRIVSEGALEAGKTLPDPFTEKPGNYFGGHTIVRQGFASLQLQGVEFYQLGQGGSIMHYPVHFHLARKTPQPSTATAPPITYVKDCSVHDSMTRWYTVHGTQGVTLQRNVGYLSIGHGYYLEDGTEINNKLYSNIGIFARAAVDNPQNPRKVPGILASPGEPEAEIVPYHSDYDHPAVFWIMNGWNDFQYNMAAGAGACGMCYWLVPGANSGPSQNQKWFSYASMQIGIGRAGQSPLKSFVGNTCSTAMNSFETVGDTSPCKGIGEVADGQHLFPIKNNKAPARFIKNPNPPPPDIIPNPAAAGYYPLVSGSRMPTKCDTDDCSATPRCGGTLGVPEQTCMVTTLDHYTTSFNWAQTNFGAIWLRPWWFLVTDSAITDVQNGGLTFVTGGGYTRSDFALGNWLVARHSVFVGNSQPNVEGTQFPENPYAANAGPFNPMGLRCDVNRIDYCLSAAEGISMETAPFAVSQRLFSIYDGPAFQESNGYFDIRKTTLGDCKPAGSGGGLCLDSEWMYGHANSVLRGQTPSTKSTCYLPNAAIAWKQPNGFYYAPAFHSNNLSFTNVDIRHFVVEPTFKHGTFQIDPVAADKRYCTWKNDMFVSFTDIDRQTELSDDDGSLTGLLSKPSGAPMRETISVNEDDFFNAPVETTECASDAHFGGEAATKPPATAKTSPYEYVTLAAIQDCAVGCQIVGKECVPNTCNGDWGKDCTTADPLNAPCYGVPLYREFVTAAEGLTARPVVKMMGQGIGQRSTMTVNHGRYFVDTTVSRADQLTALGNPPRFNLSVFLSGHTIYFFLVYGKPSTQQTYDIFVGKGAKKEDVLAGVLPKRIGINDANLGVNDPVAGSAAFVKAEDYNSATGILTVSIFLSGYASEFEDDRVNFCEPPTYCLWDPSKTGNARCGCAPGTDCKDNGVCTWGVKDIDCPTKGCFGFGVTLPSEFSTGPQPNLPPASSFFPTEPVKFPNDAKHWNVPFHNVDAETSGQQCRYSSPPSQP